ncbi:MAG: T9SS type A sorting domain-containing protein [Candidatus Poribacteria bacterium]|nr:T9SS type A sorting domain-containing protein [Candidatus Poribacteria bacterium]
MFTQIRTSALFYVFTLFVCLNFVFVLNIAAQDKNQPVEVNYTFESIDVPGVDFLALTASSDFGDYAGYTKSADGKKEIAFTLINDVFTTYDFPGSQKTHFFALGNNGVAAGHYKDSDGLYHGVVLDENGELKQYDFPGAVETFIFGISDETGALSGNIVDTDGVTHGFSGDMSITFPGAVKTYADFVNSAGVVVGSYIAADGSVHGFRRDPDGSFTTIDVPETPNLQFLFVNAINNVGVVIFRAKAVDDIQRSYILLPSGITHELRFPGSVSTVVRNINQDGSIIGYYDSADGRRHGFVGSLTTQEVSDYFSNVFNITLTKGLNMLSLPLASPKPMTAKSLAGIAGATVVIALDAANQRFVGWTAAAPNDGFPIEGGQGYIVNVPQPRNFAFVGSRWTNPMDEVAAAPIATTTPREAWAFVVSGQLEGTQNYDGYLITVRNLRTRSVMTAQVTNHYFAAATADLSRRSVVQVGDTLEVTVSDKNGNIASEKFSFEVTPNSLANALLTVNLDGFGKPKGNLLLQNYPNPFNPETWIPYQLSNAGPVSISIYDTTGGLVRTLAIGYQSQGFYHNRGRAAYWDGKNTLGERVASGIYFYKIETPTFQRTRQLVILK